MPLYSVDIQKRIDTYYWTNRYCIEADTLTLASNVVPTIVDKEKLIHSDIVIFDKARVSDFTPSNDQFIIVPLTGTGGVAVTGDPYPLFNVVRVDFSVGIGRPSRKYYRTAFGESQADGDHWSSGYFATVVAAMDSLVAVVDSFVDVDGQPIIAAIVALNIGMRQQRRGSKRRVTPVI